MAGASTTETDANTSGGLSGGVSVADSEVLSHGPASLAEAAGSLPASGLEREAGGIILCNPPSAGSHQQHAPARAQVQVQFQARQQARHPMPISAAAGPIAAAKKGHQRVSASPQGQGQQGCSLPEAVATRLANGTVMMRGPRMRVGVDCSAGVHAALSPSTGRITYRGR